MNIFSPCWTDSLRRTGRTAQAFYLFDAAHPENVLCLIEQVSGGDEWLTIEERLPLESGSVGRTLRKKGRDYATALIQRMQRATLTQC